MDTISDRTTGGRLMPGDPVTATEKALWARIATLESALKDRNKLIEMQLQDKTELQKRIQETAVLQREAMQNEVDRLRTENAGYAQLLGSANNDVNRLTKYADWLEKRHAELLEALQDIRKLSTVSDDTITEYANAALAKERIQYDEATIKAREHDAAP